MSVLIGCPLPHKEGHVVFLSTDIGGCITNKSNPKYTDVYTDTFPSGVTVAVNCEKFYDLWQCAVKIDMDDDEEEKQASVIRGVWH